MATRITIEVEDIDQASADALGLWLAMVMRDESEHTVQKIQVERLV